MVVYGPTNVFASQSGNVPVSQLDQDFTDAFAGINNAFLSGTLAARPAVDGVGKGRYYFATDDRGGTLYRDNGAAWVQVAFQVGPQIPIVAAAGTADAITATYSPAITLADLQLCFFVATAANATTTPTFAPNGLTAHTITKKGGQALIAGDIPGALAVCLVEYNIANTRWELLNPASLGTALTNSLGSDVALNNTANYFDGPSVAQGTTGTWFVSGTVTVLDTASAVYNAKLWDGTTVIASTAVAQGTASFSSTMSLSGVITAPAGNLRISVKDGSTVNGLIKFNASGNSKDSTITAIRIA